MRAIRDPFLIVIILLSLAIGSSVLTRGHEWGDDWASYTMQAQSILNDKTHEFIERNTFTIFESSFQLGPVAYPWGYPLILTPAIALKGVHALPLKLPGLFLFAGFLFCFFLLIKDRLTRTESLFLVSVFAFNPTLITFLDQILSDIPFLFFIFLGLLLIIKLKSGAWNSIVLGVVIFFAFFIRTTGIILLASFLVYQAFHFYRERSERQAIVRDAVIVTASFIFLWLALSPFFPNGQGSYFRQLMGLTPEIFFSKNLPGYFDLFWQFFGLAPAWIYPYYVLIVFFIIGLWTRRSADQFIIIFFVLYLTAMLFWPEWQGIRFIFPLLPIFIYFAFQGIAASINKLPEQYRSFSKGISYIFWIVIIGIFLYNSSTHAYFNLKDDRKINGPFDPYSSDVYNFIRIKTPPDSVVVFFKPRAMRLFTDRNTLMSTDCERLKLGNYAVISYKAENSQIPPDEIGKCGLGLLKVFENKRFIIYEIPK